jgi:cation transporter-like permease
MKSLRRHLERLRNVKKRKYSPLIHRLHKKHHLSKRTLFYIKEYGHHTNALKTIIKESLRILILASLLSSFGGLAFESIKEIFLSIVPLIILLPALNDMIGDYGVIISSRFTTLLHTGKIRGAIYKNHHLRHLLAQIFIISGITAVISATISLLLSLVSAQHISLIFAYKIFLITIIDVAFLVFILSLVSICAGLYLYKKGEDPDNFLIPITTSIADLGNMLMLVFLVLLFF